MTGYFYTAGAGRPESAFLKLSSPFQAVFATKVASTATINDSKTASRTSLQANVTAKLPICPDRRGSPVFESTTKTLTGFIACDMKIKYSQ
jgi:hypothetical protein